MKRFFLIEVPYVNMTFNVYRDPENPAIYHDSFVPIFILIIWLIVNFVSGASVPPCGVVEIILDVVGAFAIRFLGSSTLSRRVGGTTRPVGRGAGGELGGGTEL